MQTLLPLAQEVADLLKERRETVAIAESSAGGLISAVLLAIPGASAYFLGGAVVYTARARHRYLDLERENLEGARSASEPYALILARTSRDRLGATWGLSETGASGPGNAYGDPAGHTCLALAGPFEVVRTLETGQPSRVDNMRAFSHAALSLLVEGLKSSSETQMS